MKRKIQKVRSWYVFLLLAVIIYACVDDQINEPQSTSQTELQFNLNAPSSEGGRSAHDVSDVRYVQFSIKSEDGTTAYAKEQLEVLEFSGEFISEPFALKVGDYQLKEFFLLDNEGNVLFATPKEGSELAKLVEDPLVIDFEAAEDEVNKLTPEVVTTEESSAADFGYSAFGFEVAEFFEIQLTVMVYNENEQNYELVEAELNIEAGGDLIVEESLDAATNDVLINEEEYEDYTLTITKDGYDDWAYTYSADSLKSYEGGDPLVVVLEDDGEIKGMLFGVYSIEDEFITLGKVDYQGYETILSTYETGFPDFTNFNQEEDYFSLSSSNGFHVFNSNGKELLYSNEEILAAAYSNENEVFYGIADGWIASIDINGTLVKLKELERKVNSFRRWTMVGVRPIKWVLFNTTKHGIPFRRLLDCL